MAEKSGAPDPMHQFEIDSMSQLEVRAIETNLPSRFVAAAIAKWDGATIESECSTGTFIEDYLRFRYGA